MPRSVTISDVAELAGVHTATVSRALNPSTQGQVSAETMRRVQKAAKTLGYVPNMMARSLRTKLSTTIGVLIPDLTNPIFPPMIRGIENYLAPRGYTALLANTDGRESVERTATTSLLERRVDGLIIATGLEDHPILGDLYRQGVKIVMANRGAGAVPYPLVTGNDAAGVVAAVRHLKDLGHREILHISGPANVSTSRIRANAMKEACEMEGLRLQTIQAAALTADAGHQVMDQLLTERRTFTAVQTSNDLLALGVLRSLRRHGVACPGDVSVVGFNDMPFAEEFSRGLTTVKVPLEEIGAQSARILIDAIESGKIEPVIVTLPVSLVIRASTGPARP